MTKKEFIEIARIVQNTCIYDIEKCDDEYCPFAFVENDCKDNEHKYKCKFRPAPVDWDIERLEHEL